MVSSKEIMCLTRKSHIRHQRKTNKTALFIIVGLQRRFLLSLGLLFLPTLSGTAGRWNFAIICVAASESLRGSNPHEERQLQGPQVVADVVFSSSSSSASTGTIPIATVEVPLFAKSGTHHVEIFVGQPPVPQVLIVDTGSRLTAWLCHVDEVSSRHKRRKLRYDPANSTTVQTIACGECRFEGDSKCGQLGTNTETENLTQDNFCIVKQRYTEGSSWTAYEVNDVLSLSGVQKRRRRTASYEDSLETIIPFTFGCQTEVTGLFKKQFAHGILGLERTSHQSLPAQLYRHGVTQSAAFSLCLSANAGALGLGGALRSKHLEPMQLTPLLQNYVTNNNSNKTISSGLYAVAVEEVWLGDACLVSEEHNRHLLEAFSAGKGTILDSGTTDTFLPAALRDVFDTAWLEQTGKPVLQHHQSRAATYSIAEFRALPAIHFVFADTARLTVPAAHYMEGAAVFETYGSLNMTDHDEDVHHVLQNRVYTNEPVGAVLGINSMLGYDILYDTENSKIGFARANC